MKTTESTHHSVVTESESEKPNPGPDAGFDRPSDSFLKQQGEAYEEAYVLRQQATQAVNDRECRDAAQGACGPAPTQETKIHRTPGLRDRIAVQMLQTRDQCVREQMSRDFVLRDRCDKLEELDSLLRSETRTARILDLKATLGL